MPNDFVLDTQHVSQLHGSARSTLPFDEPSISVNLSLPLLIVILSDSRPPSLRSSGWPHEQGRPGHPPRPRDHARCRQSDRPGRGHPRRPDRGGRDRREIQPLIGPGTKVIDAGGKTLLPGLYDSHVHPLGAAHSEADHPIPVFESLADVMAYFAERVKAQPKGTWIVARYAFPTRLSESRFPTRAELDSDRAGAHGPAPGRAGRRRQHEGPGSLRHHPRHARPAGRADRQGSAHRRADRDAAKRVLGPQGPARRRLWRRWHTGRRARETALLAVQRARDHQHRRPGSERRGLEALPRAARSRRADRTDQRHADAEPTLR